MESKLCKARENVRWLGFFFFEATGTDSDPIKEEEIHWEGWNSLR